MADTKIEWAEKVWNPVTGCTKISAGCRNCYAERMSKRLAGRYGYPEAPHNFDVTLHPDRLSEPLHWRKPRRVFVCSMGDLFHEDVPRDFIVKVWSIMLAAKQHTFLVLTKRPGRMRALLNQVAFPYNVCRIGHFEYPLPNVWLGVTAENQARANERIPILLQIPAVVRFVSLEPMLGPINLSGLETHNELADICTDALRGECMWFESRDIGSEPMGEPCERLDWVIVGGESGPNSLIRPMDLDWVRNIRDQCLDAGVPFMFKQKIVTGKKVSLPELDGKVWNEYPEVV